MKNVLLISALVLSTAITPAFAQVNTTTSATATTSVGGPQGSFTKTESVKTENGVVVDHNVSAQGDPSVAAAVDAKIGTTGAATLPGGAIPDLNVLPDANGKTITEKVHDTIPPVGVVPPVAIVPPTVPAIVPPAGAKVQHSESVTTTTGTTSGVPASVE